jgi:hypothetical protein
LLASVITPRVYIKRRVGGGGSGGGNGGVGIYGQATERSPYNQAAAAAALYRGEHRQGIISVPSALAAWLARPLSLSLSLARVGRGERERDPPPRGER